MNLALQLLANGMVNGVLFALMACGFGLVYRTTGVFHVAFSGLFVASAYAFYAAYAWVGLPLWPAMGVALGFSAAAGWALERLLYRPFYVREAAPGVVMVASLGSLLVIENLIALAFGNGVLFIERPLASASNVGPVTLASTQILQLVTGGAALVALLIALRRFRLFKVIWAIGDEPGLVSAIGLPLMPYRAALLALSAVLGAVPACLIALDVGISPRMGMTYLLIAAVAVFSGGVDRYAGWILGGFILALMQSLVVWQISSQWSDLATFAVLMLILLFRPQGLLGRRGRLEERTP